MKILKIKFKNIHNLKGEHNALHFDKEPLLSAGIFAITGPTGSGKSTLLDVITLSLFNRIPRYKKAITKKEIESLGSVVTHHTTDAYASVEYEIKGNRYTSEWKVAKNRNGNFKDYEMFLYDATGQPLDLLKSAVPAKNEELIGLQYDQFVKSIILSQGEFSRFLKASKDERGQLLENITGTSIYRKIGKKVFERNKEVKQKLSTRKEILDNVKTLSEEEIGTIHKDLKELNSKIIVLDKDIKHLSGNVQIKKELQNAISAIASLEETATHLTSKKELLQASLKKLNIHNKLSPVKDDIALYKDAQNNKVATEKNLIEYQSNIAEAKEGLKKLLEVMSELSKKKVNEKNFMKIMGDFEKEILALDKDIENSKKKGIEIRERLKKQKENYPHELANNPEKALSFLKTLMTNLQSEIEKSKLNTKSNITDSKQTLKLHQERYNDLLLIKHDQEHLRENKSKIDKTQTMLIEQEGIVKQKEPLKEKSESLVKSLKTQISNLEKRKEDAIKIASLEAHRESLVKDQPCPLCGSTEHPYSIHNPDSKFSELENEIAEVNTELEKQEKELKDLFIELNECETRIKMVSATLKESKAQLLETEKTLKRKTEKYPNKKELSKDTIEQVITRLGAENETLEKAIDAVIELRSSAEIKTSYLALQEELKKYNEINSLRQSKFDGDQIDTITNQIRNDFQRHTTSITRLTEAIEKETKDLDRAQVSLEKHKTKLQPKLKALGFATIEEMSLCFLEESEANEIVKQENEIKKLFTENETQLKSQNTAVATLTKADKLPKKTYEDLLTELSVQEEDRKVLNQSIGAIQNQLKADKESKENQKAQIAEIETLNKESEKWSLLAQMIGDANGNKFANFSQGLTLQNLLVFANHRLKNLSERYLLDKPKDGGPLLVVDLFQGNTHRAVSTLSGGESFLISLALALSLSDMASRNVSIESLFIDEGFGTLDQETLDVAMNTLEKLQSESQKMVGVISHVEALKERITVQIKLEKNAQGFSNIKIE